jgi:aryl carrier-like protein
MITGIAFPQPQDSELLHDVRFDGFRVAQDGKGLSALGGDSSQGKELQAFFLLANSTDPDLPAVLSAAITVVGTQLAKQLRLTEEMDPARPLLQYGMDSLAAVEFRNWIRATLSVELTTLDLVNAPSLIALCEKVISKMGISPRKE